MSQISETPASASTPEMEILGALPDIPTFDGESVPVSRNPLTPGTRPLQLLPLPGSEFPVRVFPPEKIVARSGGSATDASAFWDLLDPPMRARVVAAGFRDYAAGLRRTQPCFPPAMRYALMERWNDCTHTFVFGFGEMTLTPTDYAAITGLRFTGPAPPLDARYQTAAIGAQLVRSLLGVTTQTQYTVQGCMSYETVFRFWAERIRTRLEAWRELPEDVRPAAPNKGDPAVLACLRDLSQVGSFDWATLGLAHFYHGLDVWTCGSGESNWLFIRPLEVWSYEYCIYPGGPSGDSPIESRRIPRYLAHCHHTYASGEDPEYWWSFLNDWELSDLSLEPWDCEAWRTYPGQEVAELYTRSRLLMRGYWADRYFLGERVFDTPIAPAQRRVPHAPPRHMCLLEGLTREDLEAPPPVQLDPEHTTHVPAQRYQEICSDSGLPDPTSVGSTLMYISGLATIGSMNLNYVLYASLDRSMAYFPDRISRQYGMIQHVPRVHNFESGLITSHLLTNLADHWQSRNTVHLDEGMMQDTVSPAYANWFFTPQ
ncbi:hypothetical protein JCGZ_18558 [Jatropha curcas]|uniref:Aminotransferase-like plant mobile domain-containing protein n=1 Tax=Jatropha curcas TaxID=180498 RepID=A0A067K4V2_JATCU|nr:hypothetical protein JCGZ_18558 [Jatropha curcas]